jgi:hypothetical protein
MASVPHLQEFRCGRVQPDGDPDRFLVVMFNYLPGIMVHGHNPSTQRLKQEDHEMEADLGYIVRPYLKQTNKKIQLPKIMSR